MPVIATRELWPYKCTRHELTLIMAINATLLPIYVSLPRLRTATAQYVMCVKGQGRLQSEVVVTFSSGKFLSRSRESERRNRQSLLQSLIAVK